MACMASAVSCTVVYPMFSLSQLTSAWLLLPRLRHLSAGFMRRGQGRLQILAFFVFLFLVLVLFLIVFSLKGSWSSCRLNQLHPPLQARSSPAPVSRPSIMLMSSWVPFRHRSSCPTVAAAAKQASARQLLKVPRPRGSQGLRSKLLHDSF